MLCKVNDNTDFEFKQFIMETPDSYLFLGNTFVNPRVLKNDIRVLELRNQVALHSFRPCVLLPVTCE